MASRGTFVILEPGSGSELGREESSIHGLYLPHLVTHLSNLISICLTNPMQNERKYVLNRVWGLLSLYMTVTILLLSIFVFERPQWPLRKLSAIAMTTDTHQKAVLFLLWVMHKSQALACLNEGEIFYPFAVRICLTVSFSEQIERGCLC